MNASTVSLKTELSGAETFDSFSLGIKKVGLHPAAFFEHEKSKIVGLVHLLKWDVKILVSEAHHLLMQIWSDPSAKSRIESGRGIFSQRI